MRCSVKPCQTKSILTMAQFGKRHPVCQFHLETWPEPRGATIEDETQKVLRGLTKASRTGQLRYGKAATTKAVK